MFKIIRIKLKLILITFFSVTYLLCLNSYALAQDSDCYVPKPIIFVHGYSGSGSDWNYVKNELKKYFENENGLKYDYKNLGQLNSLEEAYFPKCDYEKQNNGDIPTIAKDVLGPSVVNGLSHMPDCSSTEKKVNIVAHSMGGLVTRALFKRSANYNNFVDEVIFIGTPHQGSPYASASWLLNEVYNNALPAARRQALSSISLRQSGTDNCLNALLLKNLVARAASIEIFAGFARSVKKDPAAIATEQCRLNKDVSYHSVITASYKNKTKSIPLDAGYLGKDTFLYINNVSNYLSVPNNFKIILGKNEDKITDYINKLWLANEILSMGNAFTFPAGESYNDILRFGGDGVVSLSSQSGIGGLNNIVATLNVDHSEELKQTQAILEAIDDPPVIEKVRVVEDEIAQLIFKNDRYIRKNDKFIVFKIRDYLLADIEVETMTLDGQNIIPANFDDEGKKKPYKALGKEFLKKRIGGVDDLNFAPTDLYGNLISESERTLDPGEFYIKIPSISGGKHTLYMKFKNPAGKTVELTGYISKPWIENLYFDPTRFDPPPYWYVDPETGIPYLPTETSLTFVIHDPSNSSVKLDAWVTNYDSPYRPLPFTPYRKFIDNVTTSLSGSIGNFYKNFGPFIWDGSKDGGGYVASSNVYRSFIRIKPLAYQNVLYPSADYTQYLTCNNWKDWSVGIGSDWVQADPTFIQLSRKTQSFVSKKKDSFNEEKIALWDSNEELTVSLKEISKDEATFAKSDSKLDSFFKNLPLILANNAK